MKLQLVTNQMVRSLQQALQQAQSVAFLTSFVMKSGVQLIRPDLEAALKRGVKIQWLLGDYLYVTQPEALEQLLPYHQEMEIHLYHSNGVSFHPKAYLFRGMGGDQVIVGSSNLSYSALTTGTEWNLALDTEREMQIVEDAWEQFYHLFYHEQAVALTPSVVEAYQEAYDTYHRQYPQLQEAWVESEAIQLMYGSDQVNDDTKMESDSSEDISPDQIQPRPAQQEALEALEETYADGYSKAMVVMATGLGKTYLAAFFARKFKRVLFIAHREEILHQAYRSFHAVMPERSGGFYYQKEKNRDVDCLFASVYTLGMEYHLEQFAPDEFDCIIVDEFHHAAANTYQRILAYFKPQFLLGITATPDRADQQDVYNICDGNVAYRLDFIQAIQRGWLVPYQYYGVYDPIDYSQLRWLGQKYDANQLLQAQLRKEVGQAIYEAWLHHRQSRTLVFCSSIPQADYLARFFRQQGWKAACLHSGTNPDERQGLIQQLNAGTLELLFTVDMLNEGADLPRVDTLLFVRPTESLPLFIQQMGRGLRLHPDKEYCTIIDLVGNYRHADLKLQALQGATGGTEKAKTGSGKSGAASLPPTCQIHLDTQVVELLEELAKKRAPRKEQLSHAYEQLRAELGRQPSYKEFALMSTMDGHMIKQEFSSWVAFLAWMGELSTEELTTYDRFSQWFQEVERTSMTKSYKMVLLYLMLQRGDEGWFLPITPQEIASDFYQFMREKPYRMKLDWSDMKGLRFQASYEEAAISQLLAEMPMTKWAGSSKGWATFDGVRFQFQVDPIEAELQFLYRMTQEICEYRLHAYFARKMEMIENNRDASKEPALILK